MTIGSLADVMHMSKSGLFAHFGSKESLQLATVRHTSDQFVNLVIRPALAAPRGEPRMRALFENWLEWDTSVLPGGCLFVAAAVEFDDEPGAVRDELVRNQVDLGETIARVFRGGITEGHFRHDADPALVKRLTIASFGAVRVSHARHPACLPPAQQAAERSARCATRPTRPRYPARCRPSLIEP